jgi:hypothetical protein
MGTSPFPAAMVQVLMPLLRDDLCAKMKAKGKELHL